MKIKSKKRELKELLNTGKTMWIRKYIDVNGKKLTKYFYDQKHYRKKHYALAEKKLKIVLDIPKHEILDVIPKWFK